NGRLRDRHRRHLTAGQRRHFTARERRRCATLRRVDVQRRTIARGGRGGVFRWVGGAGTWWLLLLRRLGLTSVGELAAGHATQESTGCTRGLPDLCSTGLDLTRVSVTGERMHGAEQHH